MCAEKFVCPKLGYGVPAPAPGERMGDGRRDGRRAERAGLMWGWQAGSTQCRTAGGLDGRVGRWRDEEGDVGGAAGRKGQTGRSKGRLVARWKRGGQYVNGARFSINRIHNIFVV